MQHQEYSIILDDIVADSQDGKFVKLEELFDSIFAAVTDSIDRDRFVESLYELIWRCLDKSIDELEMVNILHRVKDGKDGVLCDTLCDTLWIIGLECDVKLGCSDADLFSAYASIVKKLVKERICSLESLKCHLEIDQLLSCGIITEEFNKKMKRINTQRLYAQHKFNLIRDENEGYSKLIGFLHQSSVDEANLEKTVRSYIGIFCLDPNRVFDIILDACEFEITKYPLFRVLFDKFKTEEIPHLLEFKIIYFKTLPSKKVPQSLLDLSMLLCRDGYVNFDFFKRVWADEEIFMSEFAQNRIDAVYKYTSTMKKLSPDLISNPSKIMKYDDSFNWVNLLISACSYAPLCLVVEIWKYILATGVNPCWHAECNKALCKFLTDICLIVYEEITPFKSIAKKSSKLLSQCRCLCEDDVITDVTKLIDILKEPIFLLGPQIANEPYFYTILCRILAYFLSINSESIDKIPLYSVIKDIYRKVLLPSLCLGSPNGPINNEIWSGLQYFSQADRFDMYTYWQSEEITEDCDILFGLKKNYVSINYYIRRTSVGNVEEMSRILAYYTYSTPVFFFRMLLFQTQTYDNLIKLIVPQLKSFSNIGIDCCMFSTIEAIQDRENKVEEDGVTINRAFALITDFTSAFMRMFANRVDMSLLLKYAEQNLKKGEITILILVSKLLSCLANIPSSREMQSSSVAINTLRALSGSSTLVQATTRYKKEEMSSKSQKMLINALLKPDILMSFVLHYPRLIAELVYEKDYDSVPVLSIAFDRHCDIFYQLRMLLCRRPSYIIEMKRIVPKPSLLFSAFHLDITFGFAISRSILDGSVVAEVLANKNESIESVNGEESSAISSWDITDESFTTAVKSYYSPSLWCVLDFNCFLLFWSLEFSDICCPDACYEGYYSAMRLEVIQLKEAKREKNVTRAEVKKIGRRLSSVNDDLAELQKDQKTSVDKVAAMEPLLQRLFRTLFIGNDPKSCMILFIQHCLLPRICCSPMDALFCAEFVRAILRWRLPNYNHWLFVKRVLFVLMSMLRAVTEGESLNISVFLLEMFTDLAMWVGSEDVYKEKCKGNPCFAQNYMQPLESSVTYDGFTKIYKRWLKFISVIVVSDLQSSEYVHVRNALNFLQRMSSVYPQKSGYGDALYPYLENLKFNENGGIKTSAQMICTNLEQLKK